MFILTESESSLKSRYPDKAKEIEEIFQSLTSIIEELNTQEDPQQQEEFHLLKKQILEEYEKVQKIAEYDSTKGELNKFHRIFASIQTPNFTKISLLIKEKIDQFVPKIISNDPPELEYLLTKKPRHFLKAQAQIECYFLKNFKDAMKYYKLCFESFKNKLKQPQIYKIFGNFAEQMNQDELKFIIEIYKKIKASEKVELSKFITKDDLIKIQKINSSIFSSLNQIAKTEKNQDLDFTEILNFYSVFPKF